VIEFRNILFSTTTHHSFIVTANYAHNSLLAVKGETMLRRPIVVAAAWLEIIVGACFVAIPNLPCVLLFAVRPEGIANLLARFAGFGLFALGIAGLPSPTIASRHGIAALLVFNVSVTVLLCWIGVATSFHGVLLWPVVILHGVIAAALLPQAIKAKAW
jgi:hypothetical protein